MSDAIRWRKWKAKSSLDRTQVANLRESTLATMTCTQSQVSGSEPLQVKLAKFDAENGFARSMVATPDNIGKGEWIEQSEVSVK